MKKKSFLGLIFIFVSCFIFAQSNPWYPEEDTTPKRQKGFENFFHSELPSSKSVTLSYGYELGGFRPGIFRFAYEWKHLAGSIDIFRSSYRTVWGEIESEQTKGHFVMSGFGASGRIYSGQMGRGLFVELGASAQNPRLNIAYKGANNQDSTRFDRWKVQHVSWGAGYRIGFKPRGFFAEIQYLGYCNLNRVLLYTDPTPPVIVGNVSISRHAWFFQKYRVSTQFLAGIGYSF